MRLPGVKRLLRFKTAASTQTTARRLAEAGAPAGTLVLAERQTHGRGRMDRRWSSGKGGLYLSLILKPRLLPKDLARLSLALGAALAERIAGAAGVEARVKPPNDVLARAKGTDADFRKVCGILIEAAGSEKALDWIVIGVGVNAANRVPQALTAASLSALAGRNIAPEALLGPVLSAISASVTKVVEDPA